MLPLREEADNVKWVIGGAGETEFGFDVGVAHEAHCTGEESVGTKETSVQAVMVSPTNSLNRARRRSGDGEGSLMIYLRDGGDELCGSLFDRER